MHCWTDKGAWIEETYGWLSEQHVEFLANDEHATCMLEDGHEGDHEWSPDDEISISFVGEAPS